MKKFFAVAALVLGIFVAQVSQVQAREVLAASETRGGKPIDHYIIAESLQSANFGGDGTDFKVTIHSIQNGH